MEILSLPVQVAMHTPEQIELVSKEQNSKLKLSPEQENLSLMLLMDLTFPKRINKTYISINFSHPLKMCIIS